MVIEKEDWSGCTAVSCPDTDNGAVARIIRRRTVTGSTLMHVEGYDEDMKMSAIGHTPL